MRTRPELVSPVAPNRATRARTSRPHDLVDASVGLVDSMLNPAAEWGQGILDAAEAELRGRWPRTTTERISRPQLGIHEPFRWAAAMAAKHAALVIAVGD